MDSSPLPPELASLENVLARGPRPEPSAALRWRVLGSVRSELSRDSRATQWRFAAAFAAAVLVGLGLFLGVLQTTGLALQPDPSPPSVYEVAWRLQQISPGLSREQSLRQATLRHISAEAGGQTPLGEIPPQHDELL